MDLSDQKGEFTGPPRDGRSCYLWISHQGKQNTAKTDGLDIEGAYSQLSINKSATDVMVQVCAAETGGFKANLRYTVLSRTRQRMIKIKTKTFSSSLKNESDPGTFPLVSHVYESAGSRVLKSYCQGIWSSYNSSELISFTMSYSGELPTCPPLAS